MWSAIFAMLRGNGVEIKLVPEISMIEKAAFVETRAAFLLLAQTPWGFCRRKKKRLFISEIEFHDARGISLCLCYSSR